MPKHIHFIILFLICCSSFAQNSVTITGKIIDENSKLPLGSATVYITSVKDSTVIDYTISDKNGSFTIDTRKIQKPVFLNVSYIGYQNFKKQENEITQNKDFGVLHLMENANVLGEVVIKSEAPPIRIKKDTLEFNASSFKVRPDANVEALLKQLPGVEVSADGKITVNGKEVNNILVNGKPFFGKDGKIATKNLPSDIIDKVQVTDTKTKEEELAKEAASSENKTINLTIQDDKNKGLFGKFTGGYGSNKRYESSGLINYFKDKQKLSFLGSSNNINSIGFSMDEVFDSMGMRNIWQEDDGTVNINGVKIGGGSGITQSNMIGLNYTDVIGKLEPTGSYFYTSSENNNQNRTRQLNFLPDNSFTTESASQSRKTVEVHKFDLEFEYKIDSLTTMSYRPNFKSNKSGSTYSREQFSVNGANELLNESQNQSSSDTDNASFENNIYFNKNFKKKGRRITAGLYSSNNINKAISYNKSNTVFYQDAAPPDSRDQRESGRDAYDTYSGHISYAQPLPDSLSISTGTRIALSKSLKIVETFDFDSVTNDYSDQNALLSNYITSAKNTLSPFVAINVQKKKYSSRISMGTDIIRYETYSNYLNTETRVDKDYMYPAMSAYIHYNFTKAKSIYANYSFNASLPSASQLLPVENLSDPLNTYIGNAALDPSTNHNMYFAYNDYDFAAKSGYYIYTNGSIIDNQIVSSTVYDSNFKATTTFVNTTTTYNGHLGLNWNKTFKNEAHTFKVSLGAESGMSLTKGMTNNELYKATALMLAPQGGFTYEYGELVVIEPSYNYTINKTNYSNYIVDKSSNFTHNFKLQTTTYWPKHFVFGNDFAYTYNSNIADGFKKDFFLLNTSLGYNFLKDKFLFKVKVYDVLDQNVSATRSITPTAIRDEENIVLKRYVMFSLTYKVEKFAGKKK